MTFAPLAVVCLALGLIGKGDAVPEAAPTETTRFDATQDQPERLQADVRLRKLHLVRPDLIPYPLVVETFC